MKSVNITLEDRVTLEGLRDELVARNKWPCSTQTASLARTTESDRQIEVLNRILAAVKNN